MSEFNPVAPIETTAPTLRDALLAIPDLHHKWVEQDDYSHEEVQEMLRAHIEKALAGTTAQTATPAPTIFEVTRQMMALRNKFHTEHMLDKEDADKFDQLLAQVVEAIKRSNPGVTATPVETSEKEEL